MIPAIIAGLLIISARNISYSATLHVLDVGYGSAAHIATTEGNFMFDTGPRESVPKTLDHLKTLGVKKIDAVFLSHTHPDHIGGLLPLSRQIPIRRVYWNGLGAELASPDEILFSILTATETVALGESLTAMIIPTEFLTSDLNESSMVVLVRGKQRALLFPGDAGIHRQQEIAANQLIKKVTWLAWPHHGDRLAPAFVEAMPDLEIAAVSVGGNSYGLPVDDLESFFKGRSVTIFRTDQKGALRFELAPQ